MSLGALLELHARELARMPESWTAFRFECFPHSADPGEVLYFEVEGAVCPPKERGKGAGQPNYRKMDKATRKTLTISVAKQEAWETAWEQNTGKCKHCMGKGKVMARWSVTEGTTYKPCSKCEGTGSAATAEGAQP